MSFKLRKAPNRDLYWVVNKETNKKYSKDPLPKEKAQAQMKALYANVEGKGLVSDGLIGLLPDAVGDAIHFGNKILPAPAQDYSKPAKEFLAKYGDWKVYEATIQRQPIQKALETFFNVITLKQWAKAKQMANYDNFYHLRLRLSIVSPDNKKRIAFFVEKNEVITFTESSTATGSIDNQPVAVKNKNTTVNQFLENAEKLMGKENYFLYDAFKNNCQNFVGGLLKANGMLTPKAEAFVYQPLDVLLKNIPGYVPEVARVLTDLAARFHRLWFGNGKLRGKGRKEEIAAMLVDALKKSGMTEKAREESMKLKDKDVGRLTIPQIRTLSERLLGKDIVKLYSDLNDPDAPHPGLATEVPSTTKRVSDFYPAGSDKALLLQPTGMNRSRPDLAHWGRTHSMLMYQDPGRPFQNFYDPVAINPWHQEAVDDAHGFGPLTIDRLNRIKEGQHPVRLGQLYEKELEDYRSHLKLPEHISEKMEFPSSKTTHLSSGVGCNYFNLCRAEYSDAPSGVYDQALQLASDQTGLPVDVIPPYYVVSKTGDVRGTGIKREEFYKKYKVPAKSYSLAELSKISKVPKGILQKVYNRGIGAHETNPESVRLKGSFVKNVDAPISDKLSKEQWAMARVYSFLVGGPHDEDLRKNKGKGKQVCMPEKEYLKEHARLIKVLEDAGKEGERQKAEIKGKGFHLRANGLRGGKYEGTDNYGHIEGEKIGQAAGTTWSDYGETTKRKKPFDNAIEYDGHWWVEVKKIQGDEGTLPAGTTRKGKDINANLYHPVSEGDFYNNRMYKYVGPWNISGRDYLKIDTAGQVEYRGNRWVPVEPTEAEKDDDKKQKEEYAGRVARSDRRAELIELGKKWNEEMRRRRDSPFAPIVNGLVKVGDFLVTKVAPIVGLPPVVGEIYKAFAPPGSEFYTPGSYGDKLANLAKNAAINTAKNLVTSGADDVIKKVEASTGKVLPAMVKKGIKAGVAKVLDKAEKKVRGKKGKGKPAKPANFLNQLKANGVTPAQYLKRVRTLAKRRGYNPANISLSKDGEHKIEVVDEEGKIHKAGRVGYYDWHLYSILQARGKVEKGTAQKMRSRFRKSHSRIKGDWKSDKYSPNNLSLQLLWGVSGEITIYA